MTTADDRGADVLINKVPEITLFFWLIKMMSTTVGETAADYLNIKLGFGLGGTSLAAGMLLLATLYWHVRAKKTIPALYWLAVVLISIFGTLLTDILTDQLAVPLVLSTAMFCSSLILTLMVWYRTEGTLSIHAVDSRPRELFYWTTILFTFALGTAAGDWLAEGLGLGYLVSALLFATLIAVTALAFYRFKADAVTCFWLAYIFTRPLGASCGDLLSQPVANGGLGFGTLEISLAFLTIILLLVATSSFNANRR